METRNLPPLAPGDDEQILSQQEEEHNFRKLLKELGQGVTFVSKVVLTRHPDFGLVLRADLHESGPDSRLSARAIRWKAADGQWETRISVPENLNSL